MKIKIYLKIKKEKKRGAGPPACKAGGCWNLF
jgi:hypothetical protein